MKQIKKSYVFTEKKSFFFKYIILYEKNTSKEIRYNIMHKNQQTPKLLKSLYLLTQVDCHLLLNIQILKSKENYVQTIQRT